MKTLDRITRIKLRLKDVKATEIEKFCADRFADFHLYNEVKQIKEHKKIKKSGLIGFVIPDYYPINTDEINIKGIQAINKNLTFNETKQIITLLYNA